VEVILVVRRRKENPRSPEELKSMNLQVDCGGEAGGKWDWEAAAERDLELREKNSTVV
jgi:hypothetical protein